MTLPDLRPGPGQEAGAPGAAAHVPASGLCFTERKCLPCRLRAGHAQLLGLHWERIVARLQLRWDGPTAAAALRL